MEHSIPTAGITNTTTTTTTTTTEDLTLPLHRSTCEHRPVDRYTPYLNNLREEECGDCVVKITYCFFMYLYNTYSSKCKPNCLWPIFIHVTDYMVI